MTGRARIFQPPRTAMQSGNARTHGWMLVFDPAQASRADPLMGWSGSADTQAQVRLHFDTQEEAVAYARRHGIDFELEPPQPRRIKPKAYADNFRYDRVENWSH
jgi:antibiotic biosynthesis monooxygenase (ABM) superfamily enzyme